MWTDGEYLKRSSQLELARHFAQWGATHSKELNGTKSKNQWE